MAKNSIIFFGLYALRHTHATNLDGSPKFIEAKTTKGGIRIEFILRLMNWLFQNETQVVMF